MPLNELIQLLRNSRIDLSSEKMAQADIEKVLTYSLLQFEREVHLSKLDIIDFMIGDIGIEVKLKGAKKQDVYKQLVRYAKHQEVSQLILLSNLSMGLPESIEGKDVYFVRLGEGWI